MPAMVKDKTMGVGLLKVDFCEGEEVEGMKR
jgi:hypothetical protein